MTTIERLRNRFNSLLDDFVVLSNELNVEYFETSGGNIAIIAPNYYWSERTPEQKNRQLVLKRTYEAIFEVLTVLFGQSPKQMERELSKADKQFRLWLEFDSNWSLSPNKNANEKNIRASGADLITTIDILASGKQGRVIVVPDTNSILWHPDPISYREVVGTSAFDFLLLPTVLAELDQLKVNHRNVEVREKANQAIKRIKGWRIQGSLSQGVIVDKSITVRTEHREPNMSSTLSWLDAGNSDDRIVASVLAVQATYANARLLLATGDINLQNKADAAMIEIIEVENA